MKSIILLFLLLSPLFVRSQVFFSTDQPCGTWVADSVKITDWENVDTLKKPVTTNQRNWVENNVWQHDTQLTEFAVYYPCGQDPTYSQYQFRVCSITGIRQRRYRVYLYHYVEPVKSQYEKTIEQLKQ